MGAPEAARADVASSLSVFLKALPPYRMYDEISDDAGMQLPSNQATSARAASGAHSFSNSPHS